MLTIFRKYQKPIFAVVSVVVIASFCFFGTHGSMAPTAAEPDRVIGKAMDGSPISSKEIDQLSRFIETDINDLFVIESRGFTNILNDGVLKDDLFKSGLACKLFDRYRSDLESEFGEKLRRFRNYKLYVHPQKVLGVETIWKRFMPSFQRDYLHFIGLDPELTSESFNAVSKLYSSQRQFPPRLQRQMLNYMESQYGSMIAPDPQLKSCDLSLFHASTMSDWFGTKFVGVMSQFIHNVALYAKSQGYDVSKNEAKASLIQIGMENMQQVSQGEKVSPEEFDEMYHRQLRMLGMTESDVVRAWQKVLLFQRMYEDVGSNLFVDSLMYEQFHEYASKGAKVELYHLPEEFQMASHEDLMKLELYLDGVSSERDGFGVPEAYRNVEEVMAVAPELVEKRFLLRVAKVNREALEQDIGLRETWEWEVADSHWELICEKFSEFRSGLNVEKSERFGFLETLNGDLRERVDGFAREKMLSENPLLIRERLSLLDSQSLEIRIPVKGDREPIDGLKNREELLGLLETAAFRGEVIKGDVESFEKLTCYSEDGDVFYRIHILDRSDDFEVMSFAEGLKSGALDQMLETRLRSEYERKAISEPYEGVKGDLGRGLFKGVAKGIFARELEFEPSLNQDEMWDVATRRCLGSYIRQARNDISLGDASMIDQYLKGEDSVLPESSESLSDKSPIESQWRLVRNDHVLDRKGGNPLFSEQLFDISEGSWSDVDYVAEKMPVFYQVLETFIDHDPIYDACQEGSRMLGAAAKESLMEDLLDKIVESGSIVQVSAVVESDEE